jgi:hypothetical protein
MRLFPSLLVGLLLLTSCSVPGRKIEDENALLHSAAAEIFSARIALRVLEENGDTKKIGIVVFNPLQAPIQSVRAWVSFDPHLLLLDDLAIEDSRFVLFPPGERTIDTDLGYLKFGGAVTSPLSERELLVATFTVRTINDDGTYDRPLLSFYDWRAEGDGHTAVLSFEEEEKKVLNIVQPPSGLLL